MILAGEKDRNKLLEYIEKKPLDNVFLSADIYAYGFDNPFQEVWYIEANNNIKCVLLRYYSSLVLYSEDQDYDKESLMNVINRLDWSAITLSKEDYDYMKDMLPENILVQEGILMSLNERPKTSTKDVRLAVPSDASALIDSITKIDEFKLNGHNSSDAIQRKTKAIKDGFAIHFYIKKDGKIVSNANTGAISDKVAVLAGVFTLPKYRNKGYAKRCVGMLCNFLLDNDITPTLFFMNPIAGKMYYSLGFKDCGNKIVINKLT